MLIQKETVFQGHNQHKFPSFGYTSRHSHLQYFWYSSIKTHKTSSGLQFAPSHSFQSIPMTDKIKRHKGARYVRVYHHQDNLYASALGGSVGASLGLRMSWIQCHRVDIPTPATSAAPEVPSIWTS